MSNLMLLRTDLALEQHLWARQDFRYYKYLAEREKERQKAKEKENKEKGEKENDNI